MSRTKTNYYEAKELKSDNGFRAYIYDENGATVYLSERIYDAACEAEDAAVDWAEQQNIDVELG